MIFLTGRPSKCLIPQVHRGDPSDRVTWLLQAGNQVGESFWRMLLAEHGLDDEGVSTSLGIRDRR